jgi:hypothetical protein
VFTPATTVPAGGTITLTMPAGYFLGSVTSIASTVVSLTATSTPAAMAASTSIVLYTAGAATGTAGRDGERRARPEPAPAPTTAGCGNTAPIRSRSAPKCARQSVSQSGERNECAVQGAGRRVQ